METDIVVGQLFSHEIQYSMSLRQLANVAFAVVSGDLAAHKFLLYAEILPVNTSLISRP